LVPGRRGEVQATDISPIEAISLSATNSKRDGHGRDGGYAKQAWRSHQSTSSEPFHERKTQSEESTSAHGYTLAPFMGYEPG
jgi:hypothetical protein